MGVFPHVDGLQSHQFQQCELKADYRALSSRDAENLTQAQWCIFHELSPNLIDHLPHGHRFVVHIEDRGVPYPLQHFVEDAYQVYGVRCGIFVHERMIE